MKIWRRFWIKVWTPAFFIAEKGVNIIMKTKEKNKKGGMPRKEKRKIDAHHKNWFMNLFHIFIAIIYASDLIIAFFNKIFPSLPIKIIIFVILLTVVLGMAFLFKKFNKIFQNKNLVRKFTARYKSSSLKIIVSMISDIFGIPTLSRFI